MDLTAAPVSFAQQGLWYQAELEPGNPAFHVPVALALRGAVDRDALVSALEAIVARHEILRTTFALQGSELLQVIHPKGSVPFRDEFIGGNGQLRPKIREEIHRPFDLTRGPLLRSVLFQRTADESVLLLTMHHLVTDGWSLGVMVKELAAFYRQFSRKTAVGSRETAVEALPELDIQYADFAEWQREQAGHAWSEQLAYWKERLRAPLARPELPTDFPPPASHTYEGATEAFRIPASALQALHELSRAHGTTLFMTLLAAWKVLMLRHTGMADVVVGSPVAGRNRASIEDLVGFFVNTQVLRTDLSGNPTFAEVLKRVRETALGAWENQDIPFELLTSELQPERRAGGNPFFQVMFALQNAPRGALELPGVHVEPLDVVTDTAKLPLTVINEESGGALEVRMEYSTALFTRETVQRLGRRYERLLQAAVEDASQAVDRMPMLPASEVVLLDQWAGGAATFETPEPLHRLFERQVQRTPDAAAVTFDGATLTYRQLDERANRLAHHLRSVGVVNETLVGLSLDRSLDLVVGILGILKAGGAYVPLDPSYPASRLQFIVEDSGVAVVVSRAGQAFQAVLHEVLLDRDAAAIAARPASAPGLDVDPQQAAYVIYTSGSTGQPKGVVVTHANVARLMASTESLYDFRASDVWTLFHSYAFDFSVWEIWGALLYGGRLVVVPHATSRSPEEFHELLVRERVTVLNQTPSAFYQLMTVDERQSAAGSRQSAVDLALRYVIFGGEALDFERLRGWFDRHGDLSPQLVNMYGITETTVHVTHRVVRKSDLARSASVIGRALPDLAVTVLDANGELAPIGVPGEMYVGGGGVARGYLHRDELTAARFITREANPALWHQGTRSPGHQVTGSRPPGDPVTGQSGDPRFYRTGDLARWLPTGELEYLGRIDTQVKIRGFRIELGEIESVLRGAPGVRDAAVIARPGPSDQPRLLAYCIASSASEATPNALRQACEKQLPEYMVPSAYVLVDSFPLNANGKLDRDALPDPDLDHDVVHEAYVAPSTEVEKTLARIWGEVLGVERVGTTDNFFALGGDSILLLQVAAKSAKAGLKLTRRNLIEFQTIRELAGVVKIVAPRNAKGPIETPKTAPNEQPGPFSPAPAGEKVAKADEGAIADSYALTPLQQGLLFHSHYAPQHDFYIEQLHAEVIGELDVEAFERAWKHVIDRHAVLRTSFVLEGEPRQRVHRSVPFAIELEDWRDLDAQGQAARLQEQLAADRSRAFDLTAAPLMRVALFRLAADRWHWLWTHHHLILDGWSLTAVAGEVLQAYAAFRNQAEPELPQRRAFRDYIDWLGQQDGKAAEDFWREAMRGFGEPVSLDALQSTVSTRGGRGEIEIALSEDETARLQKWARQQQITLSTVVSAAWAKLLQTWGDTDDVAFGVTVAGRPAELAGYDQMVGPFINTLPLRVRIDADAPLEAWMREVQKQHQRVREFEYSRLVDIQRWSALPPGRNLFETMVVFENYPVDESLRAQASGLMFGPVTFVERGHYGLALAAIPGERLALRLYFDAARFDADGMHGVLEQLHALLDKAGESASVREWNLLADSEEQALQFSGTMRLDERSPHELFEEQAALHPDRVALVFEERAMTYGELDARASALAVDLRGRGVGPDAIVGIRMPRSIESIVAVLGIWKAGGAYLPLDPAYPEKRLEYMVRDAGASLVLTEGDVVNSHLSHPSHPSHLSHESNGTDGTDATSANLAYVIYTSGSTGLPKGTLVERCGVTNLAHALADAFTIGEDSRVLQFASLSFDVSASEIVMALCFGAQLHLARREEVLPGPALAQLLRDRCITHLSIVPSALAAIPAVPLPDLRCLVIGGEPCPPDLLAQWSPGRQLFNCYGPTEATVCTTYSLYEGGKLTIGRPIANARTFVLDRHGAPVPAGAPGELWIGGAGVARGYIGRPELTAQRFGRDPFSEEEGARLYRTGDLVRELPDGDLEFLGRIDEQVKVRGFRIEPGEIAQLLRERGGLDDAAVVVRAGRLVAYCVAGGEVTPRELHDLCAEWLPEHMVPSAYVFVGALPLTASGKLDRNVLPDPDLEHDLVRDAFVPAGNETEETLARVWGEVLGVPRVGTSDNFFELGGDSILSLQVVSKARQAGLQVTPREIFEHPTVGALAAVARPTVAAAAGEILASHPLTPIQRWFFEQDLAHRDHWNQAVLVEVEPSVASATLEEAIGKLARHHDAFRSRFVDGRQQYADQGVIAFERVELPADVEQHANRAQSSLDLANGPLARAVHFTGEGKSLLLLVVHHLVVDGVSWRILLDDLSRLCRGEQLEPALTFGQWAARLEAASEPVASNINYWVALESGDFRPLPLDRPGGANRAGSIEIVELRLAADETDALLRRVPAAYRTKINDALLAAFATAMRQWTESDSVWVNLEGHGRETLFDDVDLSRMVGWFTSLFPLRLKVDREESGALLQSIAGQLRALPDNGVGFGIAKYLRPDPRLAALPSPEVSFNYLGQFDQVEAASGIFRLLDGPVGEGQDRDERRIHVIDVVASVQSGELRVAWHYSRDLHRRETIERVASSFVKSLRAIIDGSAGTAVDVEDAYPLSPMQQGLLFHALQTADAGLYVEQLQGELIGALDPQAFERAWQQVIRRHEVFRTSFAWEGLEEPLQRVQREVPFRVELHDWRDSDDQDERVTAYVAEDRTRGIALNAAPLFRVALIRRGEERWHFVWTHHHILLDGWCTNLVVREVLDAYEAITKGAAAKTRRSRPYRDYIEWLGRQDAEAARKYWTRALAGFTEPSRLQLVEINRSAVSGAPAGAPTESEPSLSGGVASQSDAPPPATHHPASGATAHAEGVPVSSRRLSEATPPGSDPLHINAPRRGAGEIELTLSALETRRLQSWTRRNHVTLNTLVAGAWARLLQTFSGSTDVVFGVTVAGRPASLAGSDEMIGLFINTLPLRVGTANGVPLAEWLHGVQSRQSELRDYEYSRLVDVQRWSDVPAGEPLFDTLLAFDNYPVDRSLEQRFGDLEIRGARMTERTHYALAVSVVPSDELRVRALYDATRFDGATIGKLLECLKELLLSAAAGEARTASEWRMLSNEERQSMLALARGGHEVTRSRGHEVDGLSSSTECLGSWFTRVAAAHPQNVAVSSGDVALTYAEIERRSNQLANYLRSHGVGPESLVGLCLERSVDLVVGILGILKAGAAYVPLDPSNPGDRLRMIVEDSGISVLVTDSRAGQAFQPVLTNAALEGRAGKPVVHVDSVAIAAQPSTAPDVKLDPENAAYVIYTSGSTGRPKGCVVTHANVSRLMKQTESLYRFRSDDVWTLFHSAAFDFSVWEIWGALLYGGRLVVVPYEVSRSPEEFHELLVRERVTVLNQTPSAFRQLMSVDEQSAVGSRQSAVDLRYVIFGGEALQLDSLRGWFERHGDEKPLLVNMYGITETTVHVTFRPIRLADLGSGSRIGSPIADLQLYVLDPYQQLVPDGAVGELYVGGAGVSRGYLGRPSLTAERMIPNPFGPGRLYRTGDLARRRGSDIEYVGRADEQVKVRGFRIETGEIEAVLAQHAQVREAVVMLKPFDDGERRLAAYVVRRDSVAVDDLRAFLGARLPDYMVPAAFVFLDAMPLTSNGKVNRAALPAPSSSADSPYEAPRSEAERVLAEVWSEVLGVERVSIRDNFFALGGDSIRSIQIVSKARARGLDYSFQELFANPTIAALAGVKRAASGERRAEARKLVSDPDREKLPPDVVDAYPLTRLQQGMFFHSDFEAGATAYHDVMSYYLRAPYDHAALEVALDAMAERHPILRTSFDFTTFSEPLQLVHRTAKIQLDQTDLRALTGQDDAIREWIGHERRQAFDAAAAPLLRVHVHRRTDDSFQLSLSFHHAILDGWSVATFLSELFRAYLRLPLPDAPQSSFRDFVALERAEIESSDARGFWSELLRDAQPAPVPSLRTGARSVRQQAIEIGEETARALRDFADRAGVPLRSALLGAHLRALSHILNERDVVTGLVSNGRPEEAGGERVLGLFLNTIPFRMRIDGGSWTDLVHATFEAEQRVSRWRRYPLAEIQKTSGGAPLFDTDFNFVHFHVLDEVTAGGAVQSLGAEGFEETNFRMAVNFSWWGSPGRLSGALDYDAGAVTTAQAETYAGIYAAILEAIAHDPEEQFSERALTIVATEVDRTEVPRVALHELIAEDCGRDARSPGVRDEERSVTYAELHAHANELANALRRRGVGPDVLVGVALPPGIDRVIALLGILKAGGAYLPLDPDTPRKRLEAIVADSGIAHVVTCPGVVDLEVTHAIDVDCGEESDIAPAIRVAPDNLAYALYTSGSTGTPKGVLIPHRAIVNHMLWMQRAYPLTAEDVVFQKTPFTFDASVWEFWAPLIAGATIVVAKPGGLQDASYLVETIRCEGVTILQVVPTLLEALLAEPGFRSCRSLRRVFVGGEALSSDLVRRFREALPDAELVNLYGPTEATIDTVTHRFGGDEAFVPIGRPIDNVSAYVLNDRLQFVPTGTDGDLYLAGSALGRGYLGRPSMTAASFVADPYGEPGTRMYRTGDRARRLESGLLEFRGRADEQVKVRGHRVELAEVEAAMTMQEGVAQAVAAVVEGRLVGYIVGNTNAAALRERLHDLLPDWMVPSLFVAMNELPRTAGGKIDRKALPRPDASQAATRAEYVAPGAAAERALAAEWQSVLGIAGTGANDNFFDHGGDSILSLRIASRLRQDGWKISPKLILEQQTVARIAAAMSRTTTVAADRERSGEVALSPIQRAFFDQQLPNPNHWNQSVVLDVPADFSAEAFGRGLAAIAEHHDAFRLRFTHGEDGWRQDLVDVPASIPLERTIDFDRVQASLDISRGPLMRAALGVRASRPHEPGVSPGSIVAAGAGETPALLLVAHHLIVDAVSWRILFEDLATAYAQAVRGEEIRLPRSSSSLRSWVENLKKRAAVADASYWLGLSKVEAPKLPATETDNREADAESLITRLDAPETRQLVDDLPRRLHARVPEVLLAALSEAVTEWTGNGTLWIDAEGHGREDVFEGVDVSRTIGWFTSVFPVALDCGRLETVKAQWRAVPDNGLDFGALRWLSPDAGIREALAALPPRQISFNYLGRFDAPADAPFRASTVSGGHDRDPNARRRYLLDFNARVVDGRLSIEWTYGGRAFRREAIEALASSFLASLRRLAGTASNAIAASDFPLADLSAKELEAIAAERDSIEDILPLSPLQEGLLFHAMDDDQPGVYVQQITAVLEGSPDPHAFERAWGRALERHAVLRTSFHARELRRPLQVIERQARVAPVWLDWRSLSDRETAWQALLRDDRAAGIDVRRAPLMRLTIVRETDSRWRMLWTHHHLILDGWSLPIVMQDVVTFYREESENGVPASSRPVAGLPARGLHEAPSYANFIEWLETRDRSDEESFWRTALKGFDRPNEITLPRPARPAAEAFDFVERSLPQELTARLAAFAQSSRVTLNTILQAMWAIVTATYSRQDDVVFGVTVSGRPAELPGIDGTAGLFINTLPLHVPLKSRQTLRELLEDVLRRQAGMSQHELTPLVDVQHWSEVPPGTPLFESIFVFENYPLGESLEQSPLRDFSVRDAQSVEWTHYPLSCFATPGRELRLKLVYDAARFERRAIEEMAAYAARLLDRFVQQSEAPVASIAADPRTAAHVEGDVHAIGRLVHERIAEQAALTPNAIAIAFEERTLTYRELDERSDRLAGYLRRQGVGPDEIAGIFMDRSPEMMVALLGVLKAGGAYLPLDPRFPAERVAMMVEDAAPRVIVTQEQLASLLRRISGEPPHPASPPSPPRLREGEKGLDLSSARARKQHRTVIVDTDWAAIEHGSELIPAAALTADNLAYVIFTSGSTGRPKGVQIPHRALANLLESFERRPGMTVADTMLAVTTLSFDIAALELFLPLMTGARLVLASADDAADGDRLAALLERHRATVMQATPATWRMMLLGGWKPPASLRIWCGGEAMPPDLADALRANGSELWNVYGPTETTIWSAIHPVSGSSDARVFGSPVANTTLTVVDANLNALPPGVPGELLIGGDGLARGYRHQPGMTAERFVPDPFSKQPGARAYRTGDRVRLLHDGTIEFLGRDDGQVKIRGFRVELGEIEAAARRIDGVRDAAVVFRDGRLVGYVVRSGGGDLPDALRKTLPEYMVPGVWIDLDALPLTPNGKLDRKALPKAGPVARDEALVRPRTPLEEVLAEVWQETLGIEAVGIRENFFALGGHSLHAAQIVAWLRRAFSTKVPLRILFEAATVEQLAAVLTREQPQAPKTADVLLRIRRMSPEEKAKRLQARQAREDAAR